jgi:muramidase (phage lysozyme)
VATIREDTANATRNLPIADELRQLLIKAADAAGIDLVVVTSGGQPPSGPQRVVSTRHDNGNAADLELLKGGRALDFTVTDERQIVESFVRAAAANGATGIGAGVDYMGPTKLHVGFGTKAVWGKDGHATNAPEWLKQAVTDGWEHPSAAMTEGSGASGASPRDIVKRQAPGSTSLNDLQVMVQQAEELLGPLAGIENDGSNTILSFDQSEEIPAAPIAFEQDSGDISPRDGLDEFITSGICIVSGRPLLISAYRAAFRGLPNSSSDIPPEGRALLDTIAGTESPGYDVIYGGQRFTDFSKHPNIAVEIRSGPNRGKFSTAAGRYQFLFSTWADLQEELGLPDFSPTSQDKAAWHLAQKVYENKEGRDLLADLRNGNLDDVGPALHSTWTSLPGGIEQGVNSNRFQINFARNLRQQTGLA